jgi:HK97 family phage portal protein
MPNIFTKLFNKADIATQKEDRSIGKSVDLGFYTVTNSFYNTINPTANSCITKIANTLGNIPLSVYVHKKGGGRAKAVFHPLFNAVKSPSSDITTSLFYVTMIRNILQYGNAYLYILRNVKNEIVGFNLLNPTSVVVTRDTSYNKVFSFDGKYFTSKQILHIPYTDFDGLKGVSPLERITGLLDLDAKLFEFINHYFQNSLGNRVAITPNEAWKEKDITEAYATIIPLINKYVTASDQAGKPMLLPPGTKLDSINQSNNAENDLRSLKQLVERLICSAFNVPYSLINEAENKYDSAETKQLLFLAETIKPLGEHICQSFQMALEPIDRESIYLAYTYRSTLETDTQALITNIAKEIGNGLLSVNEGRALLELDSVGDVGDNYFIPSALMALTQENIDAYMGSAKAKLIKSGIGDDKL